MGQDENCNIEPSLLKAICNVLPAMEAYFDPWLIRELAFCPPSNLHSFYFSMGNWMRRVLLCPGGVLAQCFDQAGIRDPYTRFYVIISVFHLYISKAVLVRL